MSSRVVVECWMIPVSVILTQKRLNWLILVAGTEKYSRGISAKMGSVHAANWGCLLFEVIRSREMTLSFSLQAGKAEVSPVLQVLECKVLEHRLGTCVSLPCSPQQLGRRHVEYLCSNFSMLPKW